MNLIGFQCNYTARTELGSRLSPSLLNRVALIDERLRHAGARLFLYSPKEVRPEAPTVPGFVFDAEARVFAAAAAPVPSVNGNWTHRTRRLLDEGMGYDRFATWTASRGIATYVPYAFSELIGNKLETYKVVRGFHETLHPYCEPWRRTKSQLQHFLDVADVVFLKPTTGSKGQRIVTLRRSDDGLVVTRYADAKRRKERARSLGAATALVLEATDERRDYVVQHGVETLRFRDSTFDLRVTMLHDGVAWHWLHEARLSRSGSDVSNVGQGGAITGAEELLYELLGSEASQELLQRLRSESFGLAAWLERLHPGEILEVAFDFVVDERCELRLLEINTKPGLAGIGSDVRVFDKRPDQERAFERWVYPHTRRLADFLLRKAATAPAGEPVACAPSLRCAE